MCGRDKGTSKECGLNTGGRRGRSVYDYDGDFAAVHSVIHRLQRKCYAWVTSWNKLVNKFAFTFRCWTTN